MDSEECIRHCLSTYHGGKISSALTKRAVQDSELCAYLNYVCEFCGSSRDLGGRTSLHMAASCGRTDVCKWLICQKQARIDDRDKESGYTALHRSVFYGRIDTVIALIKLGANMNLLDYNDLTPLEHAAEDNLIDPSKQFTFNEFDNKFSLTRYIYVWGSNSNYTLGPQQERNAPEILDVFHRLYPNANVTQICLEKFHTVIVTELGEVFSYGLGQGGRLGLNSEKSNVEPGEVKLTHGGTKVAVKCVMAARDHTMFLTDTANVFVCGSNTHFVLGIHPPPPQLLAPKQIPNSYFRQRIVGICCGRYHSVVWTRNIIYTWGLNLGQLGHAKTGDIYVMTPKSVSSISIVDENIIMAAAASSGATAIATSRGDIYVLHEYQCRKIASRQLNIKSINIIGGNLVANNNNIESMKRELKVLILTHLGNILIWQESDPQLNRCIFSLNRLLEVKEIHFNLNGLFLLTKAREIFHGKLKPRKRVVLQEDKIDGLDKNKVFHKFLDRSDCVMVQVNKVHKIYTADSIICDTEGENFAVLNLNTASCMKHIPKISNSTIAQDFQEFVLNTDVSEDITFKVGDSFFPAHKFIIANCSEKLSKMVENSNDDFICIDYVHPDIFVQILKYIYSGECDLLHEGRCPISLLKFCNFIKENAQSGTVQLQDMVKSDFEVCSKQSKIVPKVDGINDPLRLLQEAAKKLGINSLYKDLNNFSFVNDKIILKNNRVFVRQIVSFDSSKFRNYYDVSIQSKNGKALQAHKCILVARSEFFNHMFSMRWNEKPSKSEISLAFPQNTISHLLCYLYTDQLHLEDEDLENVTNLLVLADHLLIPRLLEICEFYLTRLISMKTLIKILSLAYYYNACQLKQSSMEYICLNLASFLEGRYLEQLDTFILKELTHFYFNWNEKMSYRVITPFSDAIDDECIKKISAEHPINMDFEEKIVKSNVAKAQRKRNRSRKISTTEKLESGKENIPSEKALPQKIVGELLDISDLIKSIPSRLVAIQSAHEKIKASDVKYEFVSLLSKLKDSVSSYNGDFPDLNASFSSPDVYPKCLNKGDRIEKHRIQKMSQKQRKRLSSENGSKEVIPDTPKNPWKMIETGSPVGSPDAAVDITSIITQEKKQKENLSKIKSKGLVFTQMEDKAIEDLYKFYNIEHVFDEIVVAERVEIGVVATPVWVQK